MTFSTYKFKITESQIHNDTFCILTSFLGSLIRYSHLYNCVPLVVSLLFCHASSLDLVNSFPLLLPVCFACKIEERSRTDGGKKEPLCHDIHRSPRKNHGRKRTAGAEHSGGIMSFAAISESVDRAHMIDRKDSQRFSSCFLRITYICNRKK